MAVTRRVLGGTSLQDDTEDPQALGGDPGTLATPAPNATTASGGATTADASTAPGPGTPTTPNKTPVTTGTPPAAPPPTPPPTSNLFSDGADASNLFNGQTYVGFSPQDHQGANLNDPLNAKYALQDYLIKNGGLQGGSTGNAAAIAAALNKQYGTDYGNPNFFNASDAETIQMPDGQYIHYAPKGYWSGPGANANEQSEIVWGANGAGGSGSSGSGSTGSGTTGTGQLSQSTQDIINSMLGQTPQQASGDVGNTSNDPLSKLTDWRLGDLIANNGKVTNDNGQAEALNLETAREQADRARNAEMSGVDANLANRGLLDQYDPAGGAHASSAQYVERNDIAPMFSNAVQNYMINDGNNASNRLMTALNDVTNRQGVISNIALQSLSQNTAFNEFLATFGLQKDQVLNELATGQNSQLMTLMSLFLQGAGTAAKGFV